MSDDLVQLRALRSMVCRAWRPDMTREQLNTALFNLAESAKDSYDGLPQLVAVQDIVGHVLNGAGPLSSAVDGIHKELKDLFGDQPFAMDLQPVRDTVELKITFTFQNKDFPLRGSR